MKKTLLILLYLLASFIVSGCGGMSGSESSPDPSQTAGAGPEETSSPGAEKNIELELFQYKPEYSDAIEQAAAEFNKDNEEIKIKCTTVNEGEDYFTTLKTLINSGNGPDIFNVGSIHEFLELYDNLEDLSDFEVVKFALNGSLKGATIDNKIYGIPYCLEGFGFIYNTELFKEANIDIESIDSLDAFEFAVKELARRKDILKIDAVFAFPAKDTQITGVYMSNAFISPEFEGDIAKTWNADKLEFKYADAFKRIIDLQLMYSVQPVAEMDNRKMTEEYFVKNKVAIIPHGSWIYNTIELLDEEFAKKIDFLPLPVEGYNEKSESVGVPMYWAINSSSSQEEKDAAKEFLNWLYLLDAGQKVIADNFRFVPAFKGFSSDTVREPLGKKILSDAVSGNVIPQVYLAYPKGWGEDVLGTDILRYAKKEIGWDEVVKNAKEAWAKARQK